MIKTTFEYGLNGDKGTWLKGLISEEITRYEEMKDGMSATMQIELKNTFEQKGQYIYFLRLLRDIGLSNYKLINDNN